MSKSKLSLLLLVLLGPTPAASLRPSTSQPRVPLRREWLERRAQSTRAALLAVAPERRLSALARGLPQCVDALLAGLGLAATLTLMGALEQRCGIKLFVPPMMASGIIFFAGAAPPNPKGFLAGTLGCGSASYALLRLLGGVVPPVAAQGCAAGALLVWYKCTKCLFPPAAVLCVLMAQAAAAGATPLSYVASPWLAGHACLYGSAVAVSQLRAAAALVLARRRLAGLPAAELRRTFDLYDTSRDGTLDANELKIALRAAVGADLPLDRCKRLVEQVDKDGSGAIDFREFEAICKDKAA